MELVPVSLFYQRMKEKRKKEFDALSYNDVFLLSACSMFEYVDQDTGEPFEGIRDNFLELYLVTLGNSAIMNSSEFTMAGTNNPETGVLVVQCVRAGSPNANGLGRDLICTTLDGRVVTIKDFETTGRDRVVYCKNNKFAFPDLTIGESADIMTEIQKSKRHNIINSRLTPVIVARDAKAKSAIEKALNENNAGSYAVVLSDNIFAEGEEKVLEVTQVKDQDKIQYLNHAYDDELRHWYNLHGLDITGASKQAQQTTAEVSSGVNSRKILPYEMLREREKAVKRMNELFGFNCKVQFSLPWRLEFELEMTPVDEATEETTEETVEVSEGETETNEEVKEGGSENENVSNNESD